MHCAGTMNSIADNFPQENAGGALKGVGTDEQWDAAFAALRRELSGRVTARSGEYPPGLREGLARFARGECSPAEIEELCRAVSSSPEELAALAAMLNAEDGE